MRQKETAKRWAVYKALSRQKQDSNSDTACLIRMIIKRTEKRQKVLYNKYQTINCFCVLQLIVTVKVELQNNFLSE